MISVPRTVTNPLENNSGSETFPEVSFRSKSCSSWHRKTIGSSAITFGLPWSRENLGWILPNYCVLIPLWPYFVCPWKVTGELERCQWTLKSWSAFIPEIQIQITNPNMDFYSFGEIRNWILNPSNRTKERIREVWSKSGFSGFEIQSFLWKRYGNAAHVICGPAGKTRYQSERWLVVFR